MSSKIATVVVVVDRFGGVRVFQDIAIMCRRMNLDYNSVSNGLKAKGEWYNKVYMVSRVSLERNNERDWSHLKPYSDTFSERVRSAAKAH